MTIDRRQVLVGASAVAISSIVPTIQTLAAPESNWARVKKALDVAPGSTLEILLDNVEQHIRRQEESAARRRVVIAATIAACGTMMAPYLIPIAPLRAPQDITALNTRRLSTSYAFDPPSKVLRKHGGGIDIEAEIIAAIGMCVAAETNEAHIRYMREQASVGGSVNLLKDNVRAAVRETAKAMSPAGNWAVVNPTVAVFMGLTDQPPTIYRAKPFRVLDDIAYYVDIYANDKVPILVGHDGSERTAITWTPYLLLFATGDSIKRHNSNEITMTMATSDELVANEAKMREQFVTLPVTI